MFTFQAVAQRKPEATGFADFSMAGADGHAPGTGFIGGYLGASISFSNPLGLNLQGKFIYF